MLVHRGKKHLTQTCWIPDSSSTPAVYYLDTCTRWSFTMFIVNCKFCAEEEGGNHPCYPFVCAARASTMLLQFALREMAKYFFSESRLSHGSESPSSPTCLLWCGFIPRNHSLSSLWIYTSRALIIFQKASWGFLVGSHPCFTAQPVLGCLYPHVAVDVSLLVACGLIQLRCD